ncbi:MAG: 30S ribosomal protein S3 [Candidatus Nealsonbacteria bacterium CG09_land_8_20_14_0_10_42_14]|uniref:Small ribosomal subunit protein uS3 n=1 Tax=Candidatus Nealsonbacteria bacterium CG09_land_8_20_14_0_10_42_14 TaxID=1974707 RepID=A0A2H0WZM2_9BACT|nr:MAG: 30S ribosomal protein S3 [Candidatus Nealsonbacteria bacterium CG09_land_8_20_14_0_10_42_14]
MTHKVHPKVFRLKELADWQSRWLSQKKFPQYLEEDFKIREFLGKKLKDSSVQDIEIERFSGKVNVIINSARPGLIIGRGGKGAEELKNRLEKILPLKKGEKREIKIEIREIRNPWLSASLAGQWVAQQLERRMPHRRVIKQALEKIMANKEAKGARIEVSGRLGGNDIARREWLKKGRLPRQTIRAVIDYAQVEALIPQGILGIKVWIYKGERF